MIFILLKISKSTFYELSDNPLNGVLFDLKDKKNIFDVVRLYASSVWFDNSTILYNNVSNLLNFNSNYRWHSNHESKPNIIFEFVENFLYITNYSFSLQSSNFPTSWYVEGSNNKKKWTKISSVNDYDVQEGLQKAFPTVQGTFKFFRFTLLKNKHNSGSGYDNTFVLKRVEFFGFLGTNEPYLKYAACQTILKKKSPSFLFYMCFFVVS